jgi:hypothetical protein
MENQTRRDAQATRKIELNCVTCSSNDSASVALSADGRRLAFVRQHARDTIRVADSKTAVRSWESLRSWVATIGIGRSGAGLMTARQLVSRRTTGEVGNLQGGSRNSQRATPSRRLGSLLATRNKLRRSLASLYSIQARRPCFSQANAHAPERRSRRALACREIFLQVRVPS